VTAAAPGFAFRGPGLDRSELLRENPDELRRRWPSAAVVVVDEEGHARFPGDVDAPEALVGAALAAELPSAASLLGVAGDTTWFALPHEVLADALPGRLDLRSAAARWPLLDASVLAQARALLHWHRRNRHCGGCGHPLALGKAGWVARCGGCGIEHYPRTDPAIIVAVSDGERILLGRQATWPEKRWSVLAGFVEPGESLEQAIAREVMEEAGVPVLDSRYAASQPWPFPSALMIGFHATGLPVEPVVSDELEHARWFSLAELDAAVAAGELLLSPRISIARTLIDEWMEGQRDR
jgi:NAD+ diphosphatase